jgi:hypothetical protein
MRGVHRLRPASTAEIRGRREAAISVRKRALTWWDKANRGAIYDPKMFRREILQRRGTVSLAEIMAAAGCRGQGLSIILSINSGQPGPTAGDSEDKRADQSSPGGPGPTNWTTSGPLAVSPIRPLSHLSTWAFALQQGTPFHVLSTIAKHNPVSESIRERSLEVWQVPMSDAGRRSRRSEPHRLYVSLTKFIRP